MIVACTTAGKTVAPHGLAVAAASAELKLVIPTLPFDDCATDNYATGWKRSPISGVTVHCIPPILYPPGKIN